MARRRHKRGRHSLKIPVITLAILAGQAAIAHSRSGGDWKTGANVFQSFYTGIDMQNGTLYAPNLMIGWVPWLTKGLISKVARPLGATPRVPFGLPISIS